MHNRKVNKCSLAIAGMVIVLLTTTSTSDSAFAKHLRDVNQAASISNSCLNPVSNSNTNDNMISNGNCGGTVSQQGKSGQASTPTTVQTGNPTIEVQRSTTTAQPPLTTTRGNCTACFDPLTAAQKSEFEGIVQHRSSIVFGTNITTIEQLCTFLRNIVLQGRDPIESIEQIQSMLMDVEGVSSGNVSNITSCMQRAIE
jgi:hypothetical protein